ncbi:hypothetical protein ALC56_00439 [Trachymyrmex septentrionalis]|uniref:Uncharacterized protein n=1 Tax=Trachymyrmex septentrionalis TaxID=34720 RepID=A0A195FZF7_9HYME|nr:hypothetical protein ALC56_00439 [Trachymyrmex septentrionalis]
MSLREIGVPSEERSKTAAIRHLATSQSGARALPCFRPATSTSDCKLHPSELPGEGILNPCPGESRALSNSQSP